MLFFDLIDILKDTSTTIAFMQARGYLPSTKKCTACRRDMNLQQSAQTQDKCIWRCCRCKRTTSIRKDTIYENRNMTLQKMLVLVYLTNLEVNQTNISAALDIEIAAISNFQVKLRDAYSQFLLNQNARLGGIGCVVEIDESLIAKTKPSRNARARPVTAKWVFGLFDRNQGLGIIRFVENRNAETLLPIIQEVCLPGTTIYSDGWSAYNQVARLGFQHEVVIHRNEFVVTGTDIHTNNVENYWKRCKSKLKRMNGCIPSQLSSYLDEFLWNERYGKSLHERFANTLSIV
jgi:transposase